MYRRKIVLDFDGTVIRLFANCTLVTASHRIHGLLAENGVNFDTGRDVFDAFSCVLEAGLRAEDRERLLNEVDAIITEEELSALESGIVIDGFRDFLRRAKEENIAVGIASNNSAECIRHFLDTHAEGFDIPVVGREALHPELMKPHPHSLEQICAFLDCTADGIVFIGDNIRDYRCAENFGAEFIALTPTTAKRERIIANGLDTDRVKIVTDFTELIKLLFT